MVVLGVFCVVCFGEGGLFGECVCGFLFVWG